MQMVHRYWLHGLTSLGLLLVLGPLGVSAQPKNPTAAQKAAQEAAKKAAAEQHRAQLFQAHIVMLGELHQAHHLLATAKHDYNGHRAKAVGLVDRAIHELHSEISHHNKHFNAKTHTPPLTKITPQVKGGSKETQAVSDAHLLHAGTIIQAVHAQLGQLPKGPHHAHVGRELTAAVHELQTALKIR